MEFAQWRVNCAEKTEEKVLKTIDKIMDDSNGRLYSQDLDDIKDCWEILGEIHPNMHMDK